MIETNSNAIQDEKLSDNQLNDEDSEKNNEIEC